MLLSLKAYLSWKKMHNQKVKHIKINSPHDIMFISPKLLMTATNSSKTLKIVFMIKQINTKIPFPWNKVTFSVTYDKPKCVTFFSKPKLFSKFWHNMQFCVEQMDLKMKTHPFLVPILKRTKRCVPNAILYFNAQIVVQKTFK